MSNFHSGPTAIASLLTFQTCRGSWQKAVLLSFLTGLIELFMGFFGLGFLIDFVSGPVSSGFTSAVALIILSSQIKDLFGIKAKGTTFVEMWSSILDNIEGIRVNDTFLGISCIVILLLLRVSQTIFIISFIDFTSRNFIFSPAHSSCPASKSALKKTTKNHASIRW